MPEAFRTGLGLALNGSLANIVEEARQSLASFYAVLGANGVTSRDLCNIATAPSRRLLQATTQQRPIADDIAHSTSGSTIIEPLPSQGTQPLFSKTDNRTNFERLAGSHSAVSFTISAPKTSSGNGLVEPVIRAPEVAGALQTGESSAARPLMPPAVGFTPAIPTRSTTMAPRFVIKDVAAHQAVAGLGKAGSSTDKLLQNSLLSSKMQSFREAWDESFPDPLGDAGPAYPVSTALSPLLVNAISPSRIGAQELLASAGAKPVSDEAMSLANLMMDLPRTLPLDTNKLESETKKAESLLRVKRSTNDQPAAPIFRQSGLIKTHLRDIPGPPGREIDAINGREKAWANSFMERRGRNGGTAAGPSPQGDAAQYGAASEKAMSREANQPVTGDIFFDGALVGRWMSRLLSKEADRASAGPTGYDIRRGRLVSGPGVGV